MDLKLRKAKSELTLKCYEGNDEGSKKAFAELEGLLRRNANADDFPPHQNPTIAACLGKSILKTRMSCYNV